MKLPGLVYTSPYRFSKKRRLVLATLPPILAFSYKTLARTCRTDVRGAHFWAEVMRNNGHAIAACWHETLGLAAYHYRNTGYHTLTSYSFDGELAARVVRRFGLLALRGSSSQGGREALSQLQEALRHIPVVGFTVDGPRGPRRVAKPGVAILSARTGIPVLPHAFIAVPAWRLNSWDRFMVPKPFARIIAVYGAPISAPDRATPEAIEALRVQVERELNVLHQALEDEFGLPHPDL